MRDSFSLEDQAYNAIKDAIKTLKVRPGEKISYTEWADQLKISRTPVRDALKRLEQEGLVIRETGRQWHVYTLTLQDVYKLHELREGVDTYIARLAALNLTEAQAKRIRELLKDMDAAQARDDRHAFREADTEFHRIMEAASQNPYMVKVSLNISDLLARLRPRFSIEGRIKNTYRENVKIAQALFEHDPAAAAQAQLEHIHASRDNLVKLIEQWIIPLVGEEF